jgi:hypothetical protein
MDAVSTFADVEDPWNIQCRKSPYGCEQIRSLPNALRRGLPRPFSTRWLAEELVIFGMRPNPEPLNSLRNWHTKGAVMDANSDATKASAMHGFEL